MSGILQNLIIYINIYITPYVHVHRIYRYIDIDTCYICIAPNNSENILTHTVSSVTVTP